MSKIYQIVNIGDLEKKIQKARLDVINLLQQAKNKQLNNEQIVELIESVNSELLDCEHFEFVLEERELNEGKPLS